MKNSSTNQIDNFGNLNIMDMFFTRIAKEQYVTHRFSKEYRTVLILTFLFDVLAVFVSIFAGYFYLYSMIFKTLNSILVTNIITIIALILIELFVHIGLAKFFKFFIKQKMKISIIALFFVLLLWSLSFHLSTKGLSMHQSKKVSKIEDISINFELEKNNLETLKNQQIKDIQEIQKDIKNNPTKWQDGKLSLLSSQQLTDIKELQNSISSIKQQYRTDILELKKATDKEYKADELNTQNEANEYYNIIVVIMFIELICSGFLMFSWSQVLKENKNEDYVNSHIIDIANDIDKGVSDLFKQRFATLSNSLHLALESHSNNSIPFEYENTTDTKQRNNYTKVEPFADVEIINKSNNQNIGFKMQANENKASNKQASPNQNQNPTPTPKNEPTKIKVCENCGVDISSKKHWNARYCSQPCKQTAWEKRTGQTLKYKKKK